MKLLKRKIALCLSSVLMLGGATAGEYPTDSKMAMGKDGYKKVLLSPVEEGSVLHAWSYEMHKAYFKKSPVTAKIGNSAIELGGSCKHGGSKGEFPIIMKPINDIGVLGMWFYLPPKHNMKQVGFQFADAKGESLKYAVNANWNGWKWVEVDFATDKLHQVWNQKNHDSKLDFPVKRISAVFFAYGPGESKIVIDGLVACMKGGEKKGSNPFAVEYYGQSNTENPKEPYSRLIQLTNNTDSKQTYNINFELQQDSNLYNKKLPDTTKGSNHALGAESWTEFEGKRVGKGNTLTDGDVSTKTDIPWGKNRIEAFQYVKLMKPLNITHIDFTSGDANWIRFVDVSSSIDGKNYTPVEGLQEYNLMRRWSKFAIPVSKPFKAQYLRFRYHNKGKGENVIRMPGEVYVYDGSSDEKFEIPNVGEMVEKFSKKVSIDANSFKLISFYGKKKLEAGAYVAGFKITNGKSFSVNYDNFFVMPEDLKNVDKSSRFGMNVSLPKYAELNRKLGVGWVRFENHKWAFFNPQKDWFAFDGSVAPWHVPLDKYIDMYKAAGLNYLPYIFVTPQWSSSIPEGVTKNMHGYPPKDYNDYAEAIYQSVARYGSKKADPATLKTGDKLSGLNKTNVVELWNEPNLNAPAYGPFVGTLKEYFDMFEIGAKAAKKADPNTKVSNAGFAGMRLELVDQLRTYKYTDGKSPLDYSDIINVHFYSGKTDPEVCSVDPNADRTGHSKKGNRAYRENLRTLSEWRDMYKKNTEIWMTETGYDVGGSMGRDERYQAAKLPRCVMLALAEGIDKVFIYRERGSKASMHAGSGLMTDNERIRPSWFTTATMIRQLHGFNGKALKLDVGNDDVWVYYWNENGKELITAWNIGENTVKFPFTIQKATVVDSFGRKEIKAVNGSLELDIFPVYISGFKQSTALKELIGKAKNEVKRWKKLQAKRSRYTTYLYDFGSTSKVQVLKDYGKARPYTAVVAPAKFSKEKGYGFITDKKTTDEDLHYIHTYDNRDSIILPEGNSFQVNAKRGKYVLSLRVNSEHNAKVAVACGDNTVDHDVKRGTITINQAINVTSEPVIITLPKGHVKWITMIPQE